MHISSSPPPLPGPVVSRQDWLDTAFLHWRVPAERVAPLLPPGIAPDVVDGSSWVGLIAFRLAGARFFPLLAGPALPPFTEVNVRLYGVDGSGRRGVVFLSMEADSLPLVGAARALVSLPYFWARASQRPTSNGWEYASRRRSRRGVPGSPAFALTVAVDTEVIVQDDVSVFLTARWGLFQKRGGRTRWMPNTHEPWRLHPARVVSLQDELCAAAGFPELASRPPDSVLFSPGVRARFGPPRRLPRARRA